MTPFIIIEFLLSFSVTISVFKSVSSGVNITTPALLWLLFAWYIFFHPFTFNLLVSLHLKCVYYRQHLIVFLKFILLIFAF